MRFLKFVARLQEKFLAYLSDADFIFHLAGSNRPKDPSEFQRDNVDLTMVDALEKFGRNVPIALSSSMQIDQDNPYGKSKLAAEKVIGIYANRQVLRTIFFDCPMFLGNGKPNYNSFIATFVIIF